MGKGGSDLMIARRLQELMEEHPYDPQVSGNNTPMPYRLDDAIRDLHLRLTYDQRAHLLFQTFDEVSLAGGTTTVDKAVAVLTRSVMRIIAERSVTLMALINQRKQLYESLRWPSMAPAGAE